MAFQHSYGTYNVQGSLNEWFRVNVTAAGIPTWMPSARILYDFPESGLIDGHSGHAFTVTHMGPEPIGSYQGRTVGDGQRGTDMLGIMEVDCWVDKRVAGESFTHHLRQMADMVSYLFVSARSIDIQDFYGGTTDPPNVTAIIRLEAGRQVAVGPDVNPDMRRRRFMANYKWLERVSAT